jgi:tRNA nucleotidyltransferase (CCA-adding enzyme)
MTGKINSVLKVMLEKTSPEKEEIDKIQEKLKAFLEILNKNIKKLKISCNVFLGGSFAKDTVIKKENYDIDVFVRFDRKYTKENISTILKKALAGVKNVQEVHGSRNYFKIKANGCIVIEVIPVLKVNNPKEAENITDLSYFHVQYINKKIKNKKILDEMRLAKTFCYANNVYGAESYISGFSGYGLELLIYHYKTFFNFLKAMIKINKKEKLIIDIEKNYKNRRNILLDINTAKLNSPIILVDPTYKQRNVLAALSNETFSRFQNVAQEFLKKPSINAFEKKKIDFEKIKEIAKKNKNDLIILKTATDKQEGDVAGSKLIKFYRHLNDEISNFFEIKNSGFEYSGKKVATYFFEVKRKNEIIKRGPKVSDKDNIRKFKKMHAHIFNKGGRIYAKDKFKLSIKDFLNKWEQKNKKIIQDMFIKEMRVIG